MNTNIYRLIVDYYNDGLIKRKMFVRRSLEPWQAKLMNKAYKDARLTDRWIKERRKTIF